MNYSIDDTVQAPAYLQLYEQLRRDIAQGIYPHGTKLPSKRTIAAETGVSVITAEHAVALLCDEGYTETRERSGCFVIYRSADFQSEPAVPKESAVPANLQTVAGGAFPFSVLSKTMRRVLQEYGERILVKSPNQGCDELREEISRYLARSRGISVESSRIIVGSGAEYLYGIIAQLFRGRIFALEDPSYEKIRKVYESFGITCELLPLGKNGIHGSALEKTAATVLHVTPFHSFPTGITAGISKKLAYLRWAETRDGFIVEDNYDSELTVSRKIEEPLFSMSDRGNVVYINTFSRTIAPSIRIGYLILPPELENLFRERAGFYSCTVPVFDQYVLAELLRSGDFERHVNRIRRKKRKGMPE